MQDLLEDIPDEEADKKELKQLFDQSDDVDSNSDEEKHHDNDLLNMQKQKSVPMVAISEFVEDDEEAKREEEV